MSCSKSKSCQLFKRIFGMLVIVTTVVSFDATTIAQDKYKIDGKEIEATFVKLDGAKAFLKTSEGKQVEISLFKLQSNELHQIFVVMSDKVTQAKKDIEFFGVKTEDERKWVVDGNSVRAQFQDIQDKSIYLGGPGLNQFEAEMEKLRRTDLIWVIRHCWDELEKAKKDKEKDDD